MKKILMIFIALTLSMGVVCGQEISYGTGQWDTLGLGYHRAVINVSRPAEAVRVKVPWRRLDNVENTNLIMVDALTGQRINTIYSLKRNRDFGEIVFEPVSGEGEYYLYYLPSRIGGKIWYFPVSEYEKPADTWNTWWKVRTEKSRILCQPGQSGLRAGVILTVSIQWKYL